MRRRGSGNKGKVGCACAAMPETTSVSVMKTLNASFVPETTKEASTDVQPKAAAKH
jgi:hypothetical protein